ncbi:MAG: uncharacterized protein KVP18_004997 [Porospora cf. gigantea A]|uniref:uncharacterized protein n=2 Tax=Porospora cf. gigantea A TaxID=2853593 RepID=UPI00355998D5|nr:MAG: hypothetical protein KVP18_004997 [Porospora cf. gigantea A]
MGVQGLWNLVAPAARRVQPHFLEGRKIAVDVSIWVYRLLRALRTPEGVQIPGGHLYGFFTRIARLLYFDVRPVFVFDGPPPDLKKRTLARRRALREESTAKTTLVAEKLLRTMLKRRVLQQQRGGTADGLLPESSEDQAPRSLARASSVPEQVDGNEAEALFNAESRRQRRAEYYNSIPQEFRGFSSKVRAVDEIADVPLEVPEGRLDLFDDSDSDQDVKKRALRPASEFKEYVVEVDGESRTIQLPLDTEVDPAVFDGLDPRQQYKVLVHLRDLWMADARRQAVKAKDAMSVFSNVQIESFVRNIRANEEIDKVKTVLGRELEQELRKRHQERSGQVDGQLGGIDWVESPEVQPSVSAQAFQIYPPRTKAPLPAEDTDMDWAYFPDPQKPRLPTDKRRRVRELDSLEPLEKLTFFTHVSNNDKMSKTPLELVCMARSTAPTEKAERDAELLMQEDLLDDLLAGGSEEVIPDVATPAASRPFNPNKKILLKRKTAEDDWVGVAWDAADVPVGKLHIRPVPLKTAKPPAADLAETALPNDISTASETTFSGTIPTVLETALPNDISTASETTFSGSIPTVLETALPNTIATASEIALPNAIPTVLETSLPNTIHTASTILPSVIPSASETTFSGAIPAVAETTFSGAIPAVADTLSHGAASPSSRTDVLPMSKLMEMSRTQPTADTETSVKACSEDLPIFLREAPQADSRDPDSLLEECELAEEEQILRQSLSQHLMQSETPTPEIYEEVRDLLRVMGMPFIDAPGEAEAQCAYLTATGQCHAIISDDSDALLFGGKEVFKNFFENTRSVEAHSLNAVQRTLGLDLDQLRMLAMLLGCDYTTGVRGVGIVNALEIIDAWPTFEDMFELRQWASDLARPTDPGILDGDSEIRRRFKTTHVGYRYQWSFPEEFPSTAVLDAFSNAPVNTATSPFQWAEPDYPAVLSLLNTSLTASPRWRQDCEISLALIRERFGRPVPRVQMRIPELWASRITPNDPTVVAVIRSKRLAQAIARQRKRQQGKEPLLDLLTAHKKDYLSMPDTDLEKELEGLIV